MSQHTADERAIFLAALEQGSPQERSAYLKGALAGSPVLLERVQELLHAHQDSLGPLDSPPPGLAACVTLDQPLLERPGTQIGPYKLMEQIGEGGMGLVFVAEQHEPVRRKVALKVIKPGMDTRDCLARFEAERQALALMDHPNIAKVLDAGTTGGNPKTTAPDSSFCAGRPYFVMELVKGVPITQYCDEHRLTPRDRLELFTQVCRAVQHAHQKGIIHRDIKPTNVLVASHDGQPVVKVIDFGVAKAIGQQLTERTIYTAMTQMVGTPLYMSPEQAGMSSLDIDTRTDIYSLGVLLYELLTGTTPFDKERLKQAAYDEMRRIIREEEPQKPSTRISTTDAAPSIAAQRNTDPARLSKLVRGELDWIVMKALEKDRNRRYETANGFAADVQRYLADEPVQACPPSAGYRFRKFARRNKRTVATVGIIATVLLVAVGAVGWAMRDREAREQEIARKAERDLALTEQGVRQALEQAAKARGELHAVLARPGGVQELLNQPGRWNFLIQTARSELAQARRSMAHAETGLSVELRQTLQKLEEELSGDEADRLLALRLEKIRWDMATTPVGMRLDYGKAGAEYPQAFTGFAELKEDAAAVAARLRCSPIHERLVAALDDWAYVAFVLGNDPLVEQLLAVARQAAPDPAWGDRLRQLKVWRDQEAFGKLVGEARISRLSPQLLLLVGNWLIKHESALTESWLRQGQVQNPVDFWLNFYLAAVLETTQPVESAGFYRVALAVRPESSVVYGNLGSLLGKQNKREEALATYRKAVEVDPTFAPAHCNLGNELCFQKKLDEALVACRKAIELDPKLAEAHSNLGRVLFLQKKPGEAILHFRKAVELNPKHAKSHDGLGAALIDLGRWDEVIIHSRKAIELDSKLASAYCNLGAALYKQKKLDEAIASCQKAIELNPELVVAHIVLAHALGEQGKRDEAIGHYRKAIELDPNSPAHSNLGLCLFDQGKLDEAIGHYHKAIEINPNDARAHNNLGNALRDQKKLDEAIRHYHKAIQIDPKIAPFHRNLGKALLEQNKLEEAIRHIQKAIDLDPKSAEAWDELGVALICQQKLDEAIECFRKALEIDPKFAGAYSNLGALLWEHQQEYDKAIECFRKSLELEPKNPQMRIHLAIALEQRSWQFMNLAPKPPDTRRALEAVKEAIELDPTSPMPWCYLGWIHYRSGDWRSSFEALEKSCQLADGGQGSNNQWIVLALVHLRFAAEEGLPEKERAHHRTEARRWFDQADELMNTWPGRPPDQPGQAIWDFRKEARELLGIKESKK